MGKFDFEDKVVINPGRVVLVREVNSLQDGDSVRLNGMILNLDGACGHAEIEDRRSRCKIDFSLLDPDVLTIHDWFQFVGEVCAPGVVRARCCRKLPAVGLDMNTYEACLKQKRLHLNQP